MNSCNFDVVGEGLGECLNAAATVRRTRVSREVCVERYHDGTWRVQAPELVRLSEFLFTGWVFAIALACCTSGVIVLVA